MKNKALQEREGKSRIPLPAPYLWIPTQTLEATDQIVISEFVLRNPAISSELTHWSRWYTETCNYSNTCKPDRQITHEDTMSKGDKVLIRWSKTGTPKEDFLGIPRSDNAITLIGFDLFRISKCKIIEM
jgi:hypothetical protein